MASGECDNCPFFLLSLKVSESLTFFTLQTSYTHPQFLYERRTSVLYAESCRFGVLKRKENLKHLFLRSDLSNKPKSEARLDLVCRLFCEKCVL